MQLRSASALLLALAFAPGQAHGQQWPTADPSYAAGDPALAAPDQGFGSPGQVLTSSEFDLDLTHVKRSLGDAEDSEFRFRISPMVMFFLARNVAVGGLVSFEHSDVSDTKVNQLRLGPLAGYHVGLSPRLSLLPTVGLLYGWTTRSRPVSGGKESDSGYQVTVVGRVPILFHLFPHMFVGLVPFLEADLKSEAEDMDAPKTRTFGVTLDLGFWL